MPRLSLVRARVCSCAHTRIDARAGAAPRRRRAAAIGRAIRRAIGRAIRRAIGRAIDRQGYRLCPLLGRQGYFRLCPLLRTFLVPRRARTTSTLPRLSLFVHLLSLCTHSLFVSRALPGGAHQDRFTHPDYVVSHYSPPAHCTHIHTHVRGPAICYGRALLAPGVLSRRRGTPREGGRSAWPNSVRRLRGSQGGQMRQSLRHSWARSLDVCARERPALEALVLARNAWLRLDRR